MVQHGEALAGRFVVAAMVGKGSFGRVVEAFDRQTGERVAVKIIKSNHSFRKQARVEIALLEEMNGLDPQDCHCIGNPPPTIFAIRLSTGIPFPYDTNPFRYLPHTAPSCTPSTTHTALTRLRTLASHRCPVGYPSIQHRPVPA